MQVFTFSVQVAKHDGGRGRRGGKREEKGREGQEGGRDGRAHLEARPGLGGKKAKKHPFGRFQK